MNPQSGNVFPSENEIASIFEGGNPLEAISSGKVMVRAWFRQHPGEHHLKDAHSFIFQVLESYWKKLDYSHPGISLPSLGNFGVPVVALDSSLTALAWALGAAAAQLPLLQASYEIGNLYTSVLPGSIRNGNGVFYTPPGLTKRLLDMIEDTGIDWSAVKVIDPACGGGAFLAPVAMRMVAALKKRHPDDIIAHLESHLFGLEIDPFSAWITQVLLEVALAEISGVANRRIGRIVRVTDSLHAELSNGFDVVVGNPPYGKIKLDRNMRERYSRGLFGHANYYGLFTQLAVDFCKPGGTIGYLTPTSFLSGEYFKNLRCLLQEETQVKQIDFVHSRKNVFEDVLQETMLATYVKGSGKTANVRTNSINPLTTESFEISEIGDFQLPDNHYAPWILARNTAQGPLVKTMSELSDTLESWGYRISTGPFVWNRHKSQLAYDAENAYPIIWAESISPQGTFQWKTDKKNHAPYLNNLERDRWLLTSTPCILLQRTTAKEQHKRLIAAVLSQDFISRHKYVIVENHINMILPVKEKPEVSLEILNTLLNSRVLNDAFRTISGSVAVSAYELEHLPLPSPTKLKKLTQLLRSGADQLSLDEECLKIYTANNL